ncbi:hypothetical protein CNEO_910020 [Clostridium neonatale]|nr:hypothetical protein CNEO_910020 [Clostridium neonatale]
MQKTIRLYNLNTSHVNLNPQIHLTTNLLKMDLNTSHVNLNRYEVCNGRIQHGI